jgi:hypothetical protein
MQTITTKRIFNSSCAALGREARAAVERNWHEDAFDWRADVTNCKVFENTSSNDIDRV